MKFILIVATAISVIILTAIFNPPFIIKTSNQSRGAYILNKYTGSVKFCSPKECVDLDALPNAVKGDSNLLSGNKTATHNEDVSRTINYETVPVDYDPFSIDVADINKNTCVKVTYTNPASNAMKGKERIYKPPLSDADIAALRRLNRRGIGSLSECL